MDPATFNRLTDDVLNKCMATLKVKEEDYAGIKGDRLGNFKRRARFQHRTPAQVCVGDMMKHIDAITQAVEGFSAVAKFYWADENGQEGLRQRVVDAINYLLLLYGILYEEAPPGDPAGPPPVTYAERKSEGSV